MEEDDLKYNTANTVVKKDNVTITWAELNTANSNERVRYNNVLLGSVKGLVGITVVETGVKTEEHAGNYGGPDIEVGSMRWENDWIKDIYFSWLSFWDKGICLELEKL